MAFLDFLRPFKDPARDWVAKPGLILDFNLDKNALCGIFMGSTPDRLSQLGPPEQPRKKPTDSFCYLSRGLSVDLTNGRIDSFSFNWRDYLNQGYQTFTGTFTFRSNPFALGLETTEAWLNAQLGEPYWRDEDDNEILLFYEMPRAEWQFELDKSKHLKALIVVAEPLMAEAEQRAAYRVTKPWPPR